MLEKAKEAIKNSSQASSVYIGCDSIRFKKNGKWKARYSTVVILHMDSKHGCQLFHTEEIMDDYGNLKQRLLNEVSFAISVASELLDAIGNRDFSIHLDLNSNPKYKSNIAVKEALGWVRGTLGVDAVIKPNAWAATHCADHLVRNKHLC